MGPESETANPLLTLRTPEFHSKRVNSVYPAHANTLCEAVLAPSIFLTMGEWWKYQDEKWIMTRKMTPLTTKRKTEMSIFALRTHVISLFPYIGSSYGSFTLTLWQPCLMCHLMRALLILITESSTPSYQVKYIPEHSSVVKIGVFGLQTSWLCVPQWIMGSKLYTGCHNEYTNPFQYFTGILWSFLFPVSSDMLRLASLNISIIWYWGNICINMSNG